MEKIRPRNCYSYHQTLAQSSLSPFTPQAYSTTKVKKIKVSFLLFFSSYHSLCLTSKIHRFYNTNQKQMDFLWSLIFTGGKSHWKQKKSVVTIFRPFSSYLTNI